MSDRPLYDFDEETREILIRSRLKSECKAEVIGKREGVFGDMYVLDMGHSSPPHLAAKCPNFKRFGSRKDADNALQSFLHEVDKTDKVFPSPWVNRFFDIRIINGWPFLIYRWNHGTLADLIASPSGWNLIGRLSSLLLIVRALRKANAAGILAHQDLKPENIFFSDLKRIVPGTDENVGLRYKMHVGDFGNANAYLELGKNTGTRPYMAPEQYEKQSLGIEAGPAIDVFSFGVIAHECLCDGLHPIGHITTEVWPRRKGETSLKWGEEKTWRTWARLGDKDFEKLKESCPPDLYPLLVRSLNPEPARRPTTEDLETVLWQVLETIDKAYSNNLRYQVDWFEASYQSDSSDYFKDRVDKLRKFYAGRG